MNDWTATQIKAVIEDAIKVERDHRNTLRADDNKRHEDERRSARAVLDEKFEALDKALVLQAAAYPTIRDFNDLTKKVESLLTMIRALSGLFITAGIIATVLTYWK